MSIPTPSFRKIRLVIIAILFVLFCFLVGAVKNAFASGTWETSKERWFESNIYRQGTAAIVWSVPVLNFDTPAITYTTGSTGAYNQYTGGFYFCDDQNKRVLEKAIDVQAGVVAGSLDPYLSNFGRQCNPVQCPDGAKRDDITGDCPELCNTEKDAMRTFCGGDENVDWSTFNDETCQGGQCKKKCNQSGEETFNQAVMRCDALHKSFTSYDHTICRGICGCSQQTYKEQKDLCGVYGIRDFNEITCQAICYGCQDLWNEAQALCGNKFIESWDCDNTTGEITNVKCMGEQPKATPGEEGTPSAPDPTSAPDDKDPEPDTPDNPDDPSDTKLGAIHAELQKVVQQNNDRKNQLNDATNSLKWIGENNRIIADNTKLIGDSLNGIGDDISSGVKDGLGDLENGIDGVGNSVDQLNTTLTDISTGDYSAPSAEDPYAAGDHDFSERTSEFLDQMKTTGIFSLPDMLSSSIPGGGSSILTIETGETFGGTKTVDFNDLSTAISILKYLFQIAGMVLAIRIVTLKR